MAHTINPPGPGATEAEMKEFLSRMRTLDQKDPGVQGAIREVSGFLRIRTELGIKDDHFRR